MPKLYARGESVTIYEYNGLGIEMAKKCKGMKVRES
jgi:hypothetical protein